MCDFGLVLGLAMGAAQVAGQVSAANANQEMVADQAKIEQAEQSREFIVENNAALKDASQATLEGDRAKSLAVASGAGMTGSTVGARFSEQSRQTALSIANAKDRSQAAGANYALQSQATAISANNKIATLSVNPMTALMDIATSGISNYGAFG